MKSLRLLLTLLCFLAALALPVLVHLSTWGEFDPLRLLAPLAYLASALALGLLLGLRRDVGQRWSFNQPGALLILLVLLLGGALYAWTGATWAAWLLAAALLAASLVLGRFMSAGLPLVLRLLSLAVLAGLVGLLQVGAAELEGRFSNEEFYSGVEVVLAAVQWLLVYAALAGLPQPALGGRMRMALPRWPLALLLAGGSLSFVLILGRQYQRSFFPLQAPGYPGVNASSPFLCAPLEAPAPAYSAEGNRQRLVDLLLEKSARLTPDYGLLALLTGEPTWAADFRLALLQEAREGRYTRPAGSVKYDQYLAAIRLYYYLRVRERFPDIFSNADQAVLQAWFADINQRAQTVELVDWLYALAFSKAPAGPYENQDIGAGLLALLESSGLADPALRAENQAYLAETRRGWSAAFRNTDDSLSYQQIWAENAWFQSLYDPQVNEAYRQQAFEWLLLLALPDGNHFNINPFQEYYLYGPAHLGAALLGDPRLLWLQGRSLAALEDNGSPVSSYIGLDLPISGLGVPPESGSCLLFGSSGVPDRTGPLAPDKVVFRDGWLASSRYLLLNLRFTGWHRYKATNSISLLYAGQPLVMENSSGPAISWLPLGRQLFRDKRLPRENLNGLAIPQSGLQAVAAGALGMRSVYAQDPPFYAQVEQFAAEDGDYSRTTIADWHGWQHTRSIWFTPQGPLVVRDQAEGPGGQPASIFWQLFGAAGQAGRYRLGADRQAAELVIVPRLPVEQELQPTEALPGLPNVRLELRGRSDGQLDLLSVFLLDGWQGSQVRFDPATNELWISGQAGELRLPID